MFCIKLSGEQKGSIWAWLRDPVHIDTKWEEIRDIYGLYNVALTLLLLSIHSRCLCELCKSNRRFLESIRYNSGVSPKAPVSFPLIPYRRRQP